MVDWLITGGAGFIGSNFVRMALYQSNARLIILDSLTYAGDLSRISDILSSPRITFIKGDICDYKLVLNIFGSYKVSKVIHFAAESHVDRSIMAPQKFVKTNVEGTLNLLAAARRMWAEKEDNLFIHVSTDEVYGSLGMLDAPFIEESPYRPNSPYSASKASSDHLVRSWFQTYGFPAIITNCSNNYGPWQYPEKLIPLIILNAFEGKELPVYGDGLQIRDWLHVEDHCSALLALIDKGRIGSTYNIGGNNERPNLDIVYKICDEVDYILGRRKLSSRFLIRHITDRLGHDRRYAINSSKLQKETGWRPQLDFSISLMRLIRWYIEHKEWADKVRNQDYKKFYSLHYGNR